jgi:hypothetical protein
MVPQASLPAAPQEGQQIVLADGTHWQWINGAWAVTSGSVTMAVGDNTNTSFGINHGLGTKNVAIIVKEASTGDTVEADCQATGVNTVTVTFTKPPTSGQFNVTIIS